MSDIPTHDVIMIGAGPAALAAAVYTTREDIDTLLFERGVVGGLAAITDMVDNYPGFPEGIEGLTLAGHLQKQAERFGAVSMTLEMPFKDHDDNADAEHGWSPERCKALAHACLGNLAAMINEL